MKTLISEPKTFRKINTRKACDWVQKQLSIKLAEKQVEAVKCAVESKVMVITGGPGTGKTTIINAILKIFEKLRINILLAAPTGRAAKRMSETSGHVAKTIHRLLEYSIQKGGFQKNDVDPLECDLIIIEQDNQEEVLKIILELTKEGIPKKFGFDSVDDVHVLTPMHKGTVGAGNLNRELQKTLRIRNYLYLLMVRISPMIFRILMKSCWPMRFQYTNPRGRNTRSS